MTLLSVGISVICESNWKRKYIEAHDAAFDESCIDCAHKSKRDIGGGKSNQRQRSEARIAANPAMLAWKIIGNSFNCNLYNRWWSWWQENSVRQWAMSHQKTFLNDSHALCRPSQSLWIFHSSVFFLIQLLLLEKLKRQEIAIHQLLD